MDAATKIALERILDLTFHPAVNGHLDESLQITREQVCEIYEAARIALETEERAA